MHLRKKESIQNLSGVLLSPLPPLDPGFTRYQLRGRIISKPAKKPTLKTLKSTHHWVIKETNLINIDQEFTLQIEAERRGYILYHLRG